MLSSLWHKNSAFRIFSLSGLFTIITLIIVGVAGGPAALLVALALITIEITFSFDNAVINARVLQQMSPFWQRIFLTVGIAIAVFGMRIIFPVAIVAATTALNWQDVIHLSLNEPEQYSAALHEAEPSIAAFGGAFLLMLGLHFFMDPKKRIHWLKLVEKPLAKVPGQWTYGLVTAVLISTLALLPSNPHPGDTLKAGFAGVIAYLIIHGLAHHFMPSLHHRRVAAAGAAGFVGFLYLEALDASFSLDSVIGAFALTNEVLLIAAGLGVGAIWIRSMTVYITRKETLTVYRYLEHGARYAVIVLAASLLLRLFTDVSEFATGIIGVGLIILAIIASHRYRKIKPQPEP